MKKRILIWLCMAGLFGLNIKAEELGPCLGVQSYSFRKFTFFETVDKLALMGVKYIEAYSGQELGGGLNGKTACDMDADTQKKVLDKLSSSGVKLVSYGVVKGKNDADWLAIFKFAKAMGIETITCEPEPEFLDIVEKLCKEFNIKAAIHNHAKPNHYYDPQVVLDACKGRSALVGGSPDNGHWARSGIDSIEGFKKMEGRILSVHIKDVNAFNDLKAYCVPFGTGVCNVNAILTELNRQGYKGPLIIEYESNPQNPAPDIEACVKFVREYYATGKPVSIKMPVAEGAPAVAVMADDVSKVWGNVKSDESGKWPKDMKIEEPAKGEKAKKGKGAGEKASGNGKKGKEQVE